MSTADKVREAFSRLRRDLPFTPPELISRRINDTEIQILGDEAPCSYEDVWTDEVGNVPVCIVHGQNSRHEKSEDPHRPCLTRDPWPV